MALPIALLNGILEHARNRTFLCLGNLFMADLCVFAQQWFVQGRHQRIKLSMAQILLKLESFLKMIIHIEDCAI